MHQWIQVSKETVERWKLDNSVPNDSNAHQGYAYRNLAGEEMVEFNVDNYDFLHLLADEMGFGLFRGNLCVCKPQHQNH